MALIWKEDPSGWSLLAPRDFPDEATLHDLIEKTPQILPLAGDPRLTIIGREVLLGSGYADLIAIEPTGRLVILEIKLARNAEARRAVVAQVLTYAAYLHRLDSVVLERDVLGRHLRNRGFESLSGAIVAADQEGYFEEQSFREGLNESLAHGQFRLIIVLDEAPEELVRLVGYLETVTDGLLIDLVTVSTYNIDGSQIMVPQRVDPERHRIEVAPQPVRKTGGHYVDGIEDFVSAIADAPEEQQPMLHRLTDWAVSLEQEGLVRLGTYHGTANRLTLLPRLVTDGVGLVTIWNDNGAYLSLWRSVFERRAPIALSRVEQVLDPIPVGQGNTVREIDNDLLDALTTAHREAAQLAN